MKNEENLLNVNQRAYELAKTGKYSDYLAIEKALKNEGYSGTQTFLDNERIREELKELCQIAQSYEEVQSRNKFNEWLEIFIKPIVPQINETCPNVSILIGKDSLTISSNYKRYELKKEFATNKIVGDYIDEYADGTNITRYNSYQSVKTFEEFTFQDILNMAKNVDV